MKALDQLNLRPQERRVLVIVAVLVFIVLNWIFVRPLFGQWTVVKDELAKTRGMLARYEAEIAKAPTYQALEDKLRESGSEVLSAELQLQGIIYQHATATHVDVSRYAPGVRSASAHTNQFFEDQGLTIDFSTYSTNLVEFLVALASGNSMIRVQEMNLKPDGTKTKLSGNIQFVASYLKKAGARPGMAGAAPNAAATTNAPVKHKAWAAPNSITNTPPPGPKTNAAVVKTNALAAKPAPVGSKTNAVKAPGSK